MMDNAQKKTAVLFVHGLQGTPSQFDFLIRSLPKGTAYVSLLLPGHGGSVKSFRRSGRAAWERSVQQAAVALGQNYDRVILVGHSMGCLLGLKAAMQPGIRFDAMLFIACPLRIRITARYLRNNFLAVSRRQTRDPQVLAARAANSVRAAHPLAFLTCLHPYLELLRLMREIRKTHPRPLLRVTAAFPAYDEIVSPRSFRIAREDWRFAPVVLPGSSHQYFSPAARESLKRILKAMIRP